MSDIDKPGPCVHGENQRGARETKGNHPGLLSALLTRPHVERPLLADSCPSSVAANQRLQRNMDGEDLAAVVCAELIQKLHKNQLWITRVKILHRPAVLISKLYQQLPHGCIGRVGRSEDLSGRGAML